MLAKVAHDAAQILLTPGPTTAGSITDFARQLFPDRNRSNLMERYGQGQAPTTEDIIRPPSRHALGKSYRIQAAMIADREAARGAALMALPAIPDWESRARELTLPPQAPAAPASVTVNGQANVEHTVRVDVHVDLDPELRAKIDAAASAATEFTVPLIGGGTGRMDSDAAPHRVGEFGAM